MHCLKLAVTTFINNQFEMFHKSACNCRAVNNKQNVKNQTSLGSKLTNQIQLENKKKHRFL